MTHDGKKRLSAGMHIAYGAGSFGENIAYNFFYLYFIYFLTNTVKLDPAIAGIISLIAVSWDGITDPFLGYVSDNLNSKFGRRRPMMIVFCVPLGISLFLLFTNPDFSAMLKVIYFIVLNIVFWFCFTAVDIPYIALGAELTDNFNERTKLRAVAQVFLSLGIIVISFTLVLVDFFTGVTGNSSTAWAVTGLLTGITVIGAYLISWRATRGKEKPRPAKEKVKSFNGIFKDCRSLLSIKSFRKLILSTFFVNIGIGLILSMIVYGLQYNLGFDESRISIVMLVYTVLAIAFIPLIGFISSKTDKWKTMSAAFTAAAVSGLFFIIAEFNPITLYVFVISAAFLFSTFWTLVFSMSYDICEINEVKTGKRKEGITVSFLSFAIKAGYAVGMFLTGMLLDLFHFDADLTVQSEQTLSGIRISLLILPAFIFIFALLAIVRYPLTGRKFLQLKEASESNQEEINKLAGEL